MTGTGWTQNYSSRPAIPVGIANGSMLNSVSRAGFRGQGGIHWRQAHHFLFVRNFRDVKNWISIIFSYFYVRRHRVSASSFVDHFKWGLWFGCRIGTKLSIQFCTSSYLSLASNFLVDWVYNVMLDIGLTLAMQSYLHGDCSSSG